MPKTKVNFGTVRKIALALPNVVETTSWGVPSFKVQKKLLACVPSNKSAEPDSLVVRMDIDDREHLLAEAPDIYYVTDHYVGYGAVLVRLPRVTEDILRDLLNTAYKFVTSKAAREPSKRKTSKRKRA